MTATTGFAKTSTGKLASQFAASVPNSVLTEPEWDSDEETGELEHGHSGYVQPFMNPSYLQQAYVPKTLARAAKSFPSSYDLRNKDEVTDEIRNQTRWGTCWAFAATGSAESELFPEDDVVFSPRHLAYFTYNGLANPDTPEDGTAGDTFQPWGNSANETKDMLYPWYEFGGNTFMANATLSRIGFQLEKAVPYPESYSNFNYVNGQYILKDVEKYGEVGEEYHYTTPYYLVESNYLPTKDQNGKWNGAAIKQVLMDGSSVSVSYKSAASYDYNIKNINGEIFVMQPYNGPEKVNLDHAVQIIGWDDTIPASYFKSGITGRQPKNDGGWLIRNSWGLDGNVNSMDGCFYLSYEDSSISETCQFIASADQPYDHNYQYDGTGWSTTLGLAGNPTAPMKMSNVFTATGDETIKAAAFYTTTYDCTYSIQVYTDLQDDADPTSGIKAYETEQTGSEPYAGYHTIELDTPVPVYEGEKFAIVITMKIPRTTDQMWDHETIYPIACELNGYCDGVTAEADCSRGESFISYDGEDWLDILDYDETLYGSDEKSEVTLANVCLKALTVDGHEAFLEKNALIEAVSNAQKIQSTLAYIYADAEKKTAFDQALKDAEELLQSLGATQEELDAAAAKLQEKQAQLNGVNFVKNELEETIVAARKIKNTCVYTDATASRKSAFDEALKKAEDLLQNKDAVPEDMDTARITLQEKQGLLDGAEVVKKSLIQTVFDAKETKDTYSYLYAAAEKKAAFDKALRTAEALLQNQSAALEEMKTAAAELQEKQEQLDGAAFVKNKLEETIAKAKEIGNTAEYTYATASKKEAFDKALKDAEELLADKEAALKEMAAAETALQEKLNQLDGINIVTNKLNQAISSAKAVKNNYLYTRGSADVKAAFDEALEAAEAVQANLDATPDQKNTAAEKLIGTQRQLDGKKPVSGGGGSGGGGSRKDTASNTTGDGTAVATAPTVPITPVVTIPTVTAPAPASVRSDTTMEFTLKRGSAYCFKMTVLNGSTAMPSFAVGNGNIFKTQFVAKIGNDYYFRIWAVGAPGTKTGVYTTMPGEAAQLHCSVVVG
ncbi:lectin like domain-containing protein [Clostridium sp. D33t1_170424_F3]|uniref:lectin like domain-containing protein n=1 Tax=Clostridium sp. D33t1_170424_F3 TaxID=2787099 RepID=UPI0018A931A9|nr:lectin like domain-containing protein [Clostridium sp. D33t1_170424_F3]